MDLIFYKTFYDDLINLNDNDLYNHYLNHGINEYRIISKNDFYKKFPEFDIDIYQFLNNDLKKLNKIELIKHYYYNGRNEKRKCSIKDFYNKFTNFDINIYIKFQANHENLSEKEIILKYIKKDNLSKNIIFSIDDIYNLYPGFNHKIYNTFNNYDMNEVQSLFYFHINKEIELQKIYSLKTFYQKNLNFNYYNYYKLNNLTNITEVDTIIKWYKNDLNLDTNILYKNKKDIIIYPHQEFNLNNGGVVVQYYLAKILDLLGIRVRIKNNFYIYKNHLFENFYDDDFDVNECIIIYCEAINGNPMNGKYIVRWLLSELGKNIDKNIYLTWNNNDIVYNKNLSLLYINEKIKNYHYKRKGTCYTLRKSYYHNKINYIHPENSYEITWYDTQDDYINIFNKYEFFISYDPLTFLQIISILCGCITIIYPEHNITKREWLKTTALEEYLIDNKLDNLYGIAYGNSKEEIIFAKNTIHLVKEQWNNIINYFKMKYIIPFIDDIQHIENLENTVKKYFI